MEFTVSGNLLTHLGISYVSDGGYLVEKLHPGSYAAILAGLLKALSESCAPKTMKHPLIADRLVCLFLVGVILCALYACTTTGPGNVIVFLDTFLPAGMLAFALRDIGLEQKQQLRSVIQYLLMLNAIIALAELVSRYHLVPVPGQGGELQEEFRPTALYDHALTGAAATMMGLWLPAQHAVTSGKRWLYIGLLSCALLAFGERTPIAVALIALLSCLLYRMAKKLVRRKLDFRDLALCGVVPLGAVGLVTTAIGQELGTRLGAHLYWDDSAQVRLSQFGILNLLNQQELAFGGARKDLLAMIEPLRLSSHVAVIENFWLFTFLALGIFFFPVFFASFFALLKWLWRIADAKGRFMIVTFVTVASASNSLGRKSTLLITLVACVITTASSRVFPPKSFHKGAL